MPPHARTSAARRAVGTAGSARSMRYFPLVGPAVLGALYLLSLLARRGAKPAAVGASTQWLSIAYHPSGDGVLLLLAPPASSAAPLPAPSPPAGAAAAAAAAAGGGGGGGARAGARGGRHWAQRHVAGRRGGGGSRYNPSYAQPAGQNASAAAALPAVAVRASRLSEHAVVVTWEVTTPLLFPDGLHFTLRVSSGGVGGSSEKR
ncbi:unnamed protein product [Closterium sp. Naga37s-1]|nr:unnamed protein product [Closterium sp. Naga37s-1]